MSNDRANMAYINEVPWHGLGASLPITADLDQWREAAGLKWALESSPVKYQVDGIVRQFEMEDRKVIYRNDTKAPLSVMSSGYQVVQPETIVEFFRDLIGDAGYQMETMGSLRGGRTIWALANTEKVATIMGQDRLKAYLMLATSCDGSMATVAQFTSVRVVCNNTLEFSLNGQAGGRLSVPHSTVFKPEAVRNQLLQGGKAFDNFIENADALAHRKVSKTEAVEFFINLLGIEEVENVNDLSEVSDAGKVKRVAELYSLFEKGVGQQTRSAEGTAWGLVNAATRFYDHEVRARSNDNRLNSAWFGNNRSLKNQAFSSALKLVA
jgi:phage/plasmid-like protein (TIGR03299 family)